MRDKTRRPKSRAERRDGPRGHFAAWSLGVSTQRVQALSDQDGAAPPEYAPTSFVRYAGNRRNGCPTGRDCGRGRHMLFNKRSGAILAKLPRIAEDCVPDEVAPKRSRSTDAWRPTRAQIWWCRPKCGRNNANPDPEPSKLSPQNWPMRVRLWTSQASTRSRRAPSGYLET